ncbi:uncharacterized protein LOC135473904 [Liolophura sinensis]|uniref:uncharacterized protein LOC135473904 n=1 Tax=Liolophura sinensis TaxID=3198878 RepID=UPI00315832FF
MTLCCKLYTFPRYLHNKAKSNRTILISLSLVLLLCFSYLEIFFVHRHQKFSSKHGRRFRELSHNRSANESLVSRRGSARVSRHNATKPPLDPITSSETIAVTIGGKKKIVAPPKRRECASEPSFRSIRWTVNWKWDLSSRYAELVKGLRADNEISFENLDIPKWQVEIKKQKYIVAASFQPIISEMEYKVLMETFYTLAEALHQANLTFFLYGGSHLGVYRHHGIVPWDDDVDVMLDSSQREKARTVLSNIPYYSLYSPDGHQWKFFETSLTTIIHKPYRWPFIDIFFFAENSTHIWDELPLYKNEFSYRKCDVFPLVYRPFEGGLVPVPRNPEETLQRSYNNNICKSNTYWHKFESYAPRSRKKIIRCSVIQEMFPFVLRSCANSKCLKEELKRGNVTLNTVLLPEQCKCITRQK